MIGFSRLGIQSKLILLLLGVSLTSISVMAWIGYSTGKSALSQSVQNQLKAVLVAKTNTLKNMMTALRDQVISMSDSQVAIEGMRDFRKAYNELATQKLTPTEETKLREFYQNDFIPELAKHVDGQPVIEQYMPTGPIERYLQYHYIAANPHQYEKKQDLDVAPNDKTSYGEIHARLHKFFGRAATLFGFEDMLLVDVETMNIIYSYQKTTEFATNLVNGPYSGSHLATTARIMQRTKDRDDFKIADFEAYRPNLGKPMGFAMSSIFDGSKMIGILLLQFPIDDFNETLTGNYKWSEEGLGETGECYLVGPDKTMRSRSRFMHSDPIAFIKKLRELGISPKVINQIEKQEDVINVMPVNTPSTDLALKGQSGIHQIYDYRNEEVLSAYGPFELDSLRWAVIAEMDTSEAYAPIRAFGRTVIVVATAMALGVTLLALFCSHILTHPMRLLAEGARKVGEGDTNVKIRITSHDEFGELAKVFNKMASSIRTQQENLEKQIHENQELLLNILPASAVAQRQEGDEKASRQFADVTVLFADIVGMEEFGAHAGESKALSILGDLISAFDDAAEKSGVEKVKTIGGSYLAVCGLSVTRPDHTRRVIQFAQEMARIVTIFNRDHKADLAISIGINSGPIVGGVVGRRKFLYDLWGNTVAIAKRLAADKVIAIRVTGPMREKMSEQFTFSGPIPINSEGKSPMEAWQVIG